MLHRSEYYTCDRCGKVINPRHFLRLPLKRTQVFDLNTDMPEIKAYLGDIHHLPDKKISMEINEYYEGQFNNYHLCYECRKDFERFMRNELKRQNFGFCKIMDLLSKNEKISQQTRNT